MVWRALAELEKSLGKQHPSTVAKLNNMANIYYMQGRWGEALGLYEQVLAGSEKTLGSEDPLTLKTLGNAAHIY